KEGIADICTSDSNEDCRKNAWTMHLAHQQIIAYSHNSWTIQKNPQSRHDLRRGTNGSAAANSYEEVIVKSHVHGPISFRAILFSLALTSGLAVSCVSQAAEPSSRIVTGIGSPQQLIDDLRYIVGDLAGRTKSFDDNIFPN